jgi:hypothetical protein
MRLIDAEELEKAMYHEAFEKDSDMQKWDSGCWIRYKMFENAIKAAPTIDAAPRIKARWEICSDGYYPYCSNCKCEPKNRTMTKFCPNCGADMRGESDAEVKRFKELSSIS